MPLSSDLHIFAQINAATNFVTVDGGRRTARSASSNSRGGGEVDRAFQRMAAATGMRGRWFGRRSWELRRRVAATGSGWHLFDRQGMAIEGGGAMAEQR